MEENTKYPEQNDNQGEMQDGRQTSDLYQNDYVENVRFTEQTAGVEMPENNSSQGNAYQSNGYPAESYQNDVRQGNTYQTNSYQYSTGQNGYYQNDNEQNSAYQNNAYQNGSFQNNTYMNGTYPNNTYQNYGGNYQQYNGMQPYDSQVELEEPVKVSEWVLAMVLMMIPCVNIIMMFVWAFSSTEKKSKSNFFKAYLIFFGISIAVMLLIWFAIVIFALTL